MSDAKYIVIDNGLDPESMVIFHRSIKHSLIANSLKKNVPTFDVLSAGFVTPNLKCYGESVSLKIQSRSDDSILAEVLFK